MNDDPIKLNMPGVDEAKETVRLREQGAANVGETATKTTVELTTDRVPPEIADALARRVNNLFEQGASDEFARALVREGHALAGKSPLASVILDGMAVGTFRHSLADRDDAMARIHESGKFGEQDQTALEAFYRDFHKLVAREAENDSDAETELSRRIDALCTMFYKQPEIVAIFRAMQLGVVHNDQKHKNELYAMFENTLRAITEQPKLNATGRSGLNME